MMETQKLILYVALGLVLMLLWQSWLDYTQPTQPLVETTAVDGISTPADINDGSLPVAPQMPATGGSTIEQPTESISEDSRTITVETDLIKATLSTIGADIRQVKLVDYPIAIDKPDQPLALMLVNPPDIFISETGLLGRGHEFPNHKTPFSIGQDHFRLAAGDKYVDVVFDWSADDGVSYRKIYRFSRNSYEVEIRYEINNGSQTNWSGYQFAQFVRTQVAEESSMGFLGRLPSYKGGAIYTPEEKFEKYDFADMIDGDLKRRAETGWVSMLQHYFVGAWLPQEEGPYEFYSSVANVQTAPLYRIGYKTLSPIDVAPGGTGTLENRLYIGPKEQDRLGSAAEGLKLTVDYGWLTAISSPLFSLLGWLHKVVGNWGWAIIFLTVLIKLVFFPLSAASYKSMAKMKNLQPRMKTLKERYGDDKQKFQQEMMKIYKEEKINPLGGCLPIVIQIPVFIALYWVLLESVELRQAQWFWLADLSVKDPFYILPILMGISMVVQQKLNPAPMDDIQKKVMMALPVVFTVFFLFFPGGLVLYWVVNNVLSIAQQWFIINKLQAKPK